mmetsp:Transcript_5771/g.8495  ORF Transcript_5771/g.8495 Transcript_5771/m.8495 type:complete len:210 (-) Transcript_5771:37-666(-)
MVKSTTLESNILRLYKEQSVFMLCDIQERFHPRMQNADHLEYRAKQLVSASQILKIPLIATEQYPKVFGHTLTSLKVPKETPTFAKTDFSMMAVPEVIQTLKEHKNRNVVILFGCETHICVQQTALDLIEHGYHVVVVVDAVSSARPLDHKVATLRFSSLSAQGKPITLMSTEAILFDYLRGKSNPHFKQISALCNEKHAGKTPPYSEQ